MSEDEFMRLFKYVEDFRKEMNQKFEATATQESLNRLMSTIDTFIKRIDDQEANDLARDAQFERLLDWARKVSAKTGIPLEGF